jgi:hypothetical protein
MTLTRALEIGAGRIDEEGAHLFLDRLPLRGFSGYVKLRPCGIKPMPEPPSPQRPGKADDGEEEEI